MKIVLASGSPRRRELLERAGLRFEVQPSPAEELHDPALEPWHLCEENAWLKASAVAALRPGDWIIGADTLVFLDGEPLGKPADLAAARAMLRRLAGREQQVCTGACVIDPEGRARRLHAISSVRFRPLTEAEIDAYLELVDPLDKAGGYAIQEHGERLVEEIRGPFDNVVGLPVDLVLAALPPIREGEA